MNTPYPKVGGAYHTKIIAELDIVNTDIKKERKTTSLKYWQTPTQLVRSQIYYLFDTNQTLPPTFSGFCIPIL